MRTAQTPDLTVARFAADQGWTVVGVFTDRQKSGRNTRRPGFQALTASVEAGEVDVVIVEAIDRLTRRRIVLTPDDTAAHGMAVVLETGVADLLGPAFGSTTSEHGQSAVARISC